MGKFKYVINGESSSQPVVAEFDVIESGLTKREDFAMAAMQGKCSHPEFYNFSDTWAEEIAKNSVQMADALLKELEK